ncbi:MAG: DUF6941 family protein [Planctomycetota bacterium]|jgi:hypothetical protein
MATEVPPVLLSAIICDRVIFDKLTGMPSVINIIQNINSPKYPMRNPSLIFFCELTDGHGKTKATIRLIDVEQNDKVILEQDGEVEFKDVKQIVTLALNLRGVVFEHPGEYRFQLYSGEHFLGDRKIICRHIELPPKQDPNS